MTAAVAARLASVSIRYDAATALEEVTLEVPVGQKLALVGASGAGKSSLLRALAGTVDLTAGAVEMLGSDLATMSTRNQRPIRRRIGVVSQGLDLALPMSVIHNVNAGQLGRWGSARALWSLVRPQGAVQVHAVLEAVGLADRMMSRTNELSGGERQRVAIARVLLQAPDLVLADEPTASVDPRLADALMATLCDGSHTLVVSAHDPALARRHVDRIVGLREGRVVLDRLSHRVDDGELRNFYDR